MFLVDTNVFSELPKPKPEASVIEWLNDPQNKIFLSAVTIAELQSGVLQMPEGRKKQFYQNWLDDFFIHFGDFVLDFNKAVAITWGHLEAELKRKGRPIPVRDSFLAATALHYGLTIATRNEKDFLATGVKIFNPWK